MLAGAFGFSAMAVLSWENSLISGALLLPALLCLVAVGILTYRMVLRPVMIRIGPDGLYMKRLGTVIPWEAIARIERVPHAREVLLSIIETDAGHPVFDERPLLLGAALNEKAGLPALAVAMSQYDGTPEAFEAAVRAVSDVAFVDGEPTAFQN